MPDQFWSLMPKEFWLKHAAFKRAENRRKALFVMLVRRMGHHSERTRADLYREENFLRQYPVKRWLLQPPEP